MCLGQLPLGSTHILCIQFWYINFLGLSLGPFLFLSIEMAGKGRGRSNETMRGSVAPVEGRGRSKPKRVRPEEIVLEPMIRAQDDSEIQVEAAVQGPDAPVAPQLGAMMIETLLMIAQMIQQAVQTEMARAHDTETARLAELARVERETQAA